MLEGPVLSLLMRMGIPMIISMIVGALYNIVDSIFVARISEEALTALSLVYPIQYFAHAVGVGFGVGISSQLARNLGEKQYEQSNHTASLGAGLSLVHGLVLMGIGLEFMPFYLHLYTDDTDVLSYALQYFNIVFLFCAVDSISMAMEKIYQSVGKMLVSMSCLLAGCVTNLILDPILIFGLGPFPTLGIRGAAIATGLGQTVVLLSYILVSWLRPFEVQLSIGYLQPKPILLRNLYSVGAAATLNMSLASVMLSALNGILVPFSQVYVLVLGVYYKLQALLYQAANGLVQGMRPLIGYNYGAGEHMRVRKIYRCAIGIVAAIMLAGVILSQWIPGMLMCLFTAEEEIIAVGSMALRIISLGFLPSAVSVVAAGALEALGKGPESLFISLLRYCLIILPCSYVLSQLWGPVGIWHAFWITEGVTALAAIRIYQRSNSSTRIA